MNIHHHSSKAHGARIWAAAAVFVALTTSNNAFDEPLPGVGNDPSAPASVTAPVSWNAYGPAGGRIQGVEIVVTPFY